MWITYLQLHYSMQLFSLRVQYYFSSVLSDYVILGWEVLVNLVLRPVVLALVSTGSTLSEFFRILFLPTLLGLSYFYSQYLHWLYPSLSFPDQGIDEMIDFLQDWLPLIISTGVGSYVTLKGVTRDEKKQSIEYWQGVAKDLSDRFTRLDKHCQKLERKVVRYELAMKYLRSELSERSSMLIVVQDIIDEKLEVNGEDENE